MIDQTFAEAMRRLRKSQNLTLDALVKRTGIPLERLRLIESGAKTAYVTEAVKLADALGTSTDALARGAITTYALGAFRRIADTLPTNNQSQYGGE